MVRTQLYFHTE